ncbi:MAG: chromosomal replication initiator protein DnaA [Nitrospira sp.]
METNTKQLWQNTLTHIELGVSKGNFITWFRDTFILKYEEGVIFVGVPNEFAREWLSKKFHTEILKALRSFVETVRGVEYVVVRSDKRPKKMEEETVVEAKNPAELPLNEYYINKSDNLNPRYTFDTFIIGKFNQLAHAAAQALIREPGIAYNPLFVYGDSGRGKTHLIQAVGNQLKKQGMAQKVFYVTAERFVIDYTTSVQSGTANSFKEKYRQYDVVIMDDVQLFSRTESSQEELFHLFNNLHDNNKQIIFSSDKHPNTIPNLEDRLLTRFAAGMTVGIDEPEYESRVAILKAKALKNGVSLSDEVFQYLAETIQGSIRELEGALNILVCQTQLRDQPITVLDAKQLIKETERPKKTVSVKLVIKKIADFYEIPEETIYEKTRRREVVRPRQVIMYILREDFHISYPTIGSKLGGRDHTTVMHSCDKVKEDMKKDPVLVEEIQHIRTLLK